MMALGVDMIEKLQRDFQVDVPVLVVEQSKSGRGICSTAETAGTVVGWRYEPTGSWYSTDGDPNTPHADGRLQLLRLRLRKVDGELTDLVIDDLTTLMRMDAIGT